MMSAMIALIICALPNLFAQGEITTGTNQFQTLNTIPFEDLLKIQVTTVSKQPEALREAPSAVQVITSEDIRRSGALSLPEALRLASNLQVARVDSHTWAISARGFNSTTADKLLVMIDGRRLYTPLFNGVFWDVQNVMLEDIDRIEVVSGPGASLWGANAVNGVINVVTKSAKETQGGLVTGGGGSFVPGFGSVRYGDKIGQNLYFRLYGLGFARGGTLTTSGQEVNNDWRMTQGGFRADWLPPHGEVVTFQGDFYGGSISQPNGEISANGQNLLGRWTHPISAESDFSLQLYWDRTWRRFPNDLLAEQLNNYDLDFQHRFPIGERNKFIWGAGYRLMADEVGNSPLIGFLPARRNLQLFSGFAQDEIDLVEDKISLTLGTKFEHNDYSGFEIEPGARIAWRLTPRQMVWGAVSRAVRSPSRIDTDVYINAPTASIQGGGDLFTSEKVLAYELGYRTQLGRKVSASVATFYNKYDDIRSIELAPDGVNEIILNGMRADTYGVELSGTWQALDRWRLRAGYTFFKKVLFTDGDLNGGASEGDDPHNQFLVESMLDLPERIEFDTVLRYVDNLDQPAPSVPSYFALDLRLAWHPKPNWEIAVAGQNLLDNQHPEFGSPATWQEIPRSVYGKVTWNF